MKKILIFSLIFFYDFSLCACETEYLSEQNAIDKLVEETNDPFFEEENEDFDCNKLIFQKKDFININEGISSFSKNGYKFNGSNVVESDDKLIRLNHTGVFTNISYIENIDRISFKIFGDIDNCFLYYGNDALPFLNKKQLSLSNEFCFESVNYFLFSYQGDSYIEINDLAIDIATISKDHCSKKIPVINIFTNNDSSGTLEKIGSNSVYNKCKVSIVNNDEFDIIDAACDIKLRGNSTLYADKKAYRLKFNEKQSCFGLTKQKNWVLLAEAFDGSLMHNYITQKMVGYFDDFKFAFNMKHVEVFINGEDQGCYIFCEQPDEKEGRMNLNRKIKEDTKVEDINFMVELDERLPQDTNEIEDITYFGVEGKNRINYYSIKYPEIEDFPDYNSGNNSSPKFSEFVLHLKNIFTMAWKSFDENDFEEFLKIVDEKTLLYGAIIDGLSMEADHGSYSYKLYRDGGSKIKIGPMWDYDTVAWGFRLKKEPYKDPFKDCIVLTSVYPYCDWEYFLYKKMKHEYRAKVIDYCNTYRDKIISDFLNEYSNISEFIINNFEIWNDSNLSICFENLRFFYYILDYRLNLTSET